MGALEAKVYSDRRITALGETRTVINDEWEVFPHDDIDSIIESLKQKIEHLEMNRKESERVTSHFSNDAANHQKNGQGPNPTRAREPRT